MFIEDNILALTCVAIHLNRKELSLSHFGNANIFVVHGFIKHLKNRLQSPFSLEAPRHHKKISEITDI